MDEKCPTCGGEIGDCGWCVVCDPLRQPTDDELHGIVGGLTALTTIGIGVGVVRIYQGSKLWRDRKSKN